MVGFCSQKWKKCRHELLCLRKKVEMYFVCVCVCVCFVRAVLGFVPVFSLQYYVQSVQEKHEKRSRFSKFNGACLEHFAPPTLICFLVRRNIKFQTSITFLLIQPKTTGYRQAHPYLGEKMQCLLPFWSLLTWEIFDQGLVKGFNLFAVKIQLNSLNLYMAQVMHAKR